MSEETLTIPMNHSTEESTPEVVSDAPIEGVEGLEEGGTITITGTAEDAESAAAESNPSEEPLLLGKFKSQEDLLKAYTELEKKQGVVEAEPVVEPEAAPAAEVPTEPVVAGSIEDYQNKWAETGSLTDDQWSEIQVKTGVPMETLRAYEASMVAQAQDNSASNDTAIYDAAGGQDKYDTMIDWAGKNMTDDQLASLDAQLDNPAFSAMGVSILKGAYDNANGSEPAVTLKNSSNQSLSDTDYYQNEGEMLEAMKHPEYGKGGAYDTQFDRKAMGYMKASGQA